MKRILFISQYLNRNGTEAFMMNVFRGIDHNRFAIDFLLYSTGETDYSREVVAAGGRVWRVPSRKSSFLGWHRSLNRFFKEHAHEYAAIHFCGNSLTSVAPLYYAYRYGVPVRIVHAHNSAARGLHNRLLHLMKREWAYQMATHHLACSSLAAQWFFGDKGGVVIKNGIDTAKFTYCEALRRTIREKSGIEASTTVVGHVGRFVPEKNHSFLLEVFATFCQITPDAKLCLVGNGPLQNETRAKAEALQIADKVLFLGERNDVEQLMMAMDIFLMPSFFEGLPFVLVEAQCAGLPCLISDIIHPEVCLTPGTQRIPLSDSADQWVEAMQQLLVNYPRVHQEQSIIEAGYSMKETITQLEKIYNGAKE